MPKQTQKQAARARQTERDEKETPAKDSEALKAELDELLAEVDGVLEENAEEFVDQYVQKGGE